MNIDDRLNINKEHKLEIKQDNHDIDDRMMMMVHQKNIYILPLKSKYDYKIVYFLFSNYVQMRSHLGRADPIGGCRRCDTLQSSKISFFCSTKSGNFLTFITKKILCPSKIPKFDFLVQKISLHPPNVDWPGPALHLGILHERNSIDFSVEIS